MFKCLIRRITHFIRICGDSFGITLTVFVKISVYRLSSFSFGLENCLSISPEFWEIDVNLFSPKQDSWTWGNKLSLLVLSEPVLVILEYAGIVRDKLKLSIFRNFLLIIFRVYRDFKDKKPFLRFSSIFRPSFWRRLNRNLRELFIKFLTVLFQTIRIFLLELDSF